MKQLMTNGPKSIIEHTTTTAIGRRIQSRTHTNSCANKEYARTHAHACLIYIRTNARARAQIIFTLITAKPNAYLTCSFLLFQDNSSQGWLDSSNAMVQRSVLEANKKHMSLHVFMRWVGSDWQTTVIVIVFTIFCSSYLMFNFKLGFS